MKPELKKWGMFAYIAGDNDLSEYALLDVTEMCKEGSSEDVHVSVQIDTEGDFEGLIRYEITPRDFDGIGYRKVIERLPEKDSGSSKCLQDFMKYALKRYPSRNKNAIVWSHGSGFKAVSRDAGFDYSSGNSMDMNEIVKALSNGGINRKNKLNIIGFDACLMAMLEVAHHFSDHAEILVGSQQTEPGNGWPYDQVLKHMKKNPQPHQLAKNIVNEYIIYYRKTRQSNVTQSAIIISKTSAAIKSFHDLGTFLSKNLDGYKGLINRARVSSQNFEYADYIDVLDFLNILVKSVDSKHEKLRLHCKNVITACNECILHADKYGDAVKGANGLSIWFPCSRESYFLNRAKYLKLKCNVNGSGWVNFLDEYYLN